MGITIGVLLIKKAYQIVQFFGKSSWAERHLSGGLGGTYFLVKIIGAAVIAFSMMYLFGIIDNIFPSLGIFRGFAPQ